MERWGGRTNKNIKHVNPVYFGHKTDKTTIIKLCFCVMGKTKHTSWNRHNRPLHHCLSMTRIFLVTPLNAWASVIMFLDTHLKDTTYIRIIHVTLKQTIINDESWLYDNNNLHLHQLWNIPWPHNLIQTQIICYIYFCLPYHLHLCLSPPCFKG